MRVFERSPNAENPMNRPKAVTALFLVFLAGVAIGMLLDGSLLKTPSKALLLEATSSNGSEAAPKSRGLQLMLETRNSPVKWDRELNEYQLVVGNHVFPLRYDPFSGCALYSGRSAVFNEPTEAELDRLQAVIGCPRTTNDVIRAIGKPNRIWDASETFKAQYDYTDLSKTVDVRIQVQNDGTVAVLYSGKYIRTDRR